MALTNLFSNIPANAVSDFPNLHLRRWDTIAASLLAWTALLFISMNWQIKYGIQFAAATKEITAAALVVLLLFAPPKPSRSIPLLLFAATAFCAGWLWGLHDPFYMDGILTSGRSQDLFRGESLTRFSLTYPILGAAFHWIGNWNWVGHLYVMTSGAILLWCSALFFSKPLHRALVLLLIFFAPHLFVLSKWLYMDVPVTACMVAAILLFHRAVHRNSTLLFSIGALLAVAACLLKESGFLVMPALLCLPFLAHRSRQPKTILFVILSCIAGFVSFWILYRIFRTSHAWKGEKLAWLLFNTEMLPLKQGIEWFVRSILGHLRTLTWWAFLGVALLGLVRERNPKGFILISTILICNLIALTAAMPFNLSGRWRMDPLGEPALKYLAHAMIFAMLILLAAGWFFGLISIRKPRRIDWMCWLVIIAFVFVFSASAKAKFQNETITNVFLDWRYLTPAVPFALILAARSAIRLLSQRNPFHLRLLMAISLAIGIELCALRSVNFAAWAGAKMRLNGKAYEAVRQRPEKVVYTHWPFFMRITPSLDYGSFRWKGDGIELRSIWKLPRKPVKPKANSRAKPFLVLQSQDEYQGLKVRELYPQAIFNERAKTYFLQPFRLGIDSDRHHRVYVGKLPERSKPATPRTPPRP